MKRRSGGVEEERRDRGRADLRLFISWKTMPALWAVELDLIIMEQSPHYVYGQLKLS